MKNLKQLILNIVINGLILFVIYKYIPELGFSVTSNGLSIAVTFGILGLAFWLVNSVIKSVAEIITLPIKYLTFGLSSLIINVGIFYLFEYIIESIDIGIQISIGSIIQVIIMSILITMVYSLVKKVIK